MANLYGAIQRIRRTRRRLDAPASENFDRYKPEYETILRTVADVAGDAAFDDLKQWMLDSTRERQRLPTPNEVREQARTVCTSHGATVPDDSILRG